MRFNDATGKTNGVNFRPDIWILPFLNVYAIFAKSSTSTAVDFGVWLPNGQSTEQIFNYQTTANFEAVTTGFGVTPTVGIGGGWMALDMNFSWNDIEELEKPTFSLSLAPDLVNRFS